MEQTTMRPARFRGSPRFSDGDLEVPVALNTLTRLLGLAWVRRHRAPWGLLIPGCRSVHTLGMLFRIDVLFIDAGGNVIRSEADVGPCRVLFCREAEAVLEFAGGEGRGWIDYFVAAG